MIKGLWQNYFCHSPFSLYQAPRIWLCLLYCSISLSAGYPAFMYAFSAPLGTIILRVPQNILSEPRIFGGLFPLNTILVKFLQPAKNHTLKFVKELEIVILVNLSQSAKASFPMLVTELGILILFKLLQSLYLQPIITQYFIDNKSEIWLLFLIAHSKR